MMLLQGPFESDYSLAIVNRQVAYALVEIGEEVRLHQRDNTTNYAPCQEFLDAHPRLAGLFVDTPPIHRRSFALHIPALYRFNDWPGECDPRLWLGRVDFPGQVCCRDKPGHRSDHGHVEICPQCTQTKWGKSSDCCGWPGPGPYLTSHPSEPVDFARGTFDFVHVSSCFPRKAADVLVEAFCRELYESSDRVRLIIKTFPNPHNNVEEIVRNAGVKYPGHPPIEVWLHPLNLGQMQLHLTRECGCSQTSIAVT